uniref:GOLD domain-containing protein n=1 Tax=Panagrolaimus superbus TaxID=310955 RepID=A0A914Y3S6_9BILA
MIMLKVLFSLTLICSTSAFSFHLDARDRKCFSEDVRADTIVMGKYKVPVYKPNSFETHPAVTIFIEVRDSNKKVVMSDQYTNEGKFIFQARTSGEHEICTTSNASVWINIDAGKPVEKDSEKVQETNDLQLRIFELRDLLNQVVAENNYQHNRKERMRQTIDSTNTRVFIWAITEFLLIIAMAAWQIHYLKRFFEIQRVI